MQVRVIRAYGPYRRGFEISMADGEANLRIRRGFVEACEQSQEVKKAEKPTRYSRR